VLLNIYLYGLYLIWFWFVGFFDFLVLVFLKVKKGFKNNHVRRCLVSVAINLFGKPVLYAIEIEFIEMILKCSGMLDGIANSDDNSVDVGCTRLSRIGVI